MKNTKKSFKKFSQRSTLRERQRRELLKLADETNVGTSYAKIKFTDEPYARRARGGELIADGVLAETGYGYGFVKTDSERRDLFIPEGKMGEAIDGDTVRVRYKKFTTESGEERTEGRILEILEYGRRSVIGTVENDVVRIGRRRINRLYLIPDDAKIARRIYIRDAAGAEVGDKVSAKLIRGESYSFELTADVTANFGETESREANYLAILEDGGIDTEFSSEELRLAAEAAAEPISHEGRVIRPEIIFTIDSESAKDLDDAISLTRRDSGYTLGVHIADVSHYVKEKCALDRLVMARGTSVYFTDKVVPMLPEALSNGACSLNPLEEKYALSAMIDLDAEGNIERTRIEKSVIVSRVKGIYSEINGIFEGTADGKILQKYSEILDTLWDMHSLYLILAERARVRGSVELEADEAEIILDEDGHPIDIIRRERGDAEKLIEQFMLTANEAVATLLLTEGIPCVFRTHEPPPAEKLTEFLSYAKSLGLKTGDIDPYNCSHKALARLIDEARERGIAEAVSYACLRSMSKAVYSEIHRAHFGLGIENYCHFTSPIRRLSDLATHRIIHKTYLSGGAKEKYKSYAKRAAAAATEGELRALSAERRIENLYKVIYMQERVGEQFSAAVTSVTSFGIFATLENTCEGLIPISTVDGVFLENSLSIRAFGRLYSVGDKITVRLEEADIIRGKLRFSLIVEAENE